MTPDSEIIERIQKLLGSSVIDWNIPKGGYSIAQRYIVNLVNGSSAFVKVGVDEATSSWLRDEYRAYTTIQASFMPKLLAWEDGENPILILEDLSAGHWPPPWNEDSIRSVLEMLARVGQIRLPKEYPELTRLGEAMNGWEQISKDPSGFLSLNLVSKEWLEHSLPILLKAETEVELGGDSLVHTDVRSDNICLFPDRTVLVDWNWARRGNPKLDIVAWLPSLHVEGGPEPWTFDVDEPELIAAIAGFYASHAYQPANFEGAEAIRALQLRLLKSLLPWVSRVLKLPEPDLL